MRLTPASRHMSTWRVATSTSVAPTLAKLPRPPKVIVPRVSGDTRRPECPSWRYSMARSLRQGGAGAVHVVGRDHELGVAERRVGEVDVDIGLRELERELPERPGAVDDVD